ncbi:MAG: hypothetical protein ACKOAU_21960 [Pirellula sp.]
MKKLFLILGLLVGNVAVAGEPTDLTDLGLGALQSVGEEVGNEVRGLSASANSTGLSGLSAIVYDPTTSSQFNFNTNNFSTAADENAGAGTDATTGVETAAGISAFTIDIGDFSAAFSSGLMFGGGQGAGSANFAITYALPVFN